MFHRTRLLLHARILTARQEIGKATPTFWFLKLLLGRGGGGGWGFNKRQAKSPTRRLLRKSAPGSTRSCDPESTSVCGDVGEVELQSRSVAATRGWPAAAAQGARLIGVDLRSTQRGRPRADYDRSRPSVVSARSPRGRL